MTTPFFSPCLSKSNAKVVRHVLAVLVALWLLLSLTDLGLAQEGLLERAYYIVQEGDALWDIALRFGVPVEELARINGLTDVGVLRVGAELLIPGLEGFQGRLDTVRVSYGETLRSLSRRYQVPMETLMRINRVTSPNEIFAGSYLILPSEQVNVTSGGRAMLAPGQSSLELALLRGINPWSLTAANALSATWRALPGEVLQLPGEGQSGPGALPDKIQAINLEPLPLIQGKTVVLKVSGQAGLSLSASLAEQAFEFFPQEGGYVALQGIHAMTEPGFYPLRLKVTYPMEAPGEAAFIEFSQAVFIRSGDYPFDPPLSVSSETLDPAVTGPEDELWQSLGLPATPEKMWQGLFESPVLPQLTNCWTSLFGSRRSYNGSPYLYFHSGLDFCGTIGTELYAPAAGKVVFAGPLTVRGNATVIDHGWGVYSAYDHQSEIFVEGGDLVKQGQLIGLGGATGRVTGPHLHWEVWVGGVQVDPVDWLQRSFP